MGAPEQHEADPLIGTTFADRYAILSRLGKGGMAVVYKATDKNLGREVAVKVLRKDVASDPIAAKRLVREARAAAALHHPNIITIHDVGETGGVVYVVMEILVGRPLSDVLEELGSLGVERSLHIAEQLCSALAIAHAQNIIHRDIKPENLFLLDAGGGDFVKVLDFSIAKLPTEMVTAALTRAGSVFGTPHYMAPEQVEGREVSAHTDLYATGAVLYEMIAGEPPFDGPSVIDILLKHVKVPPPSLATRGLKLPAGLADLCNRLLAKKKNDRPASASIAREEIAKILADVRHDSDSSPKAEPAAPHRAAQETVREDDVAEILEVSAPSASYSMAEPEARTMAVDTAAVTAGVIAKAKTAGHVAVPAPPAVEAPIPFDLPEAPLPDLLDLPDAAPAPAAEKRKFVPIGEDNSEQRTIVGVGLGKMVAELAKQRSASHPIPPAAVLPVPAPAPAPPPAPPPPGPAAVATPSAVSAPTSTAAPAAPTGAAQTAAPSNRPPSGPKPPPPPTGHAHTLRRPPPGVRPASNVHVDDRATTQPGLGMEPVAPAVPTEPQVVETQVVRVPHPSGAHPAPTLVQKEPFLPKPVIVIGLIFAALAAATAIWLLTRGA